jgi:protoheme IX farnesyltransferase
MEAVVRQSAAGTIETLSTKEKFAAWVELTKPRITLMVMLSTLWGYFLASTGAFDCLKHLNLAFAIILLSSGIAALNQFMERRSDALMPRTAKRPLPKGILSAKGALIFGVILSAAGLAWLTMSVNILTAVLGAIVFVSYLFLYTPLKRHSVWCTFIGAIPGAMPPLVGWAAVRGELSLEAFVLFGILFLWQFPHFHAIATMYQDDYARAGIKMLPVLDQDYKATAREIVMYAAVLLPISLLPTILGISGWIYFIVALLLGAYYLKAGIAAAMQKDRPHAVRLLKASVLYLPLLMLAMVLNR